MCMESMRKKKKKTSGKSKTWFRIKDCSEINRVLTTSSQHSMV